MAFAKFLSQLVRVFVFRSWNWTTQELPDTLIFYEKIHRFSTVKSSKNFRYQLCVITFLLLHAARLAASCFYNQSNSQWYGKWLWADIGTAFSVDYRIIFNINVAYGYFITAFMMGVNLWATQKFGRPWYSCWLKFLADKKLPTENLPGLYTLAQRVTLWKICYAYQLFSILLGCQIAAAVSLFTTYTLLRDFPFSRPISEIFLLLGLNLCWIIFYAISVLYIFLFIVSFANALICQSIYYSYRVHCITVRLQQFSGRKIVSRDNLYRIVSTVKDAEKVRREFSDQAATLNSILGGLILAAVTVALFWLYVAQYLARGDFILQILSLSILSAGGLNGYTIMFITAFVNYTADKLLRQMFGLIVRLPFYGERKRLIYHCLKNNDANDFSLRCWISFEIKLNTLLEILCESAMYYLLVVDTIGIPKNNLKIQL